MFVYVCGPDMQTCVWGPSVRDQKLKQFIEHSFWIYTDFHDRKSVKQTEFKVEMNLE